MLILVTFVMSLLGLVVHNPIAGALEKLFSIKARKKMEKNFDDGLQQQLSSLFTAEIKEIIFTLDRVTYTHSDGQSYYYTFKRLGYRNLPSVKYVYAIAVITNKRIFNDEMILSVLDNSVRVYGMIGPDPQPRHIGSSELIYGYVLTNPKFLPPKGIKTKKW